MPFLSSILNNLIIIIIIIIQNANIFAYQGHVSLYSSERLQYLTYLIINIKITCVIFPATIKII